MTDLKRILLCEDDPRDVELTVSALDEHDLANEVVVVQDGEQALDYLFRRGCFADRPEGNPAFILLDLKMPKVDGPKVLAAIRADEQLKTIPVVILTSSKEQRDLSAAYDLGANSYVVKPVVFADFVAVVREIGLFWGVVNEAPPGTASRNTPLTAFSSKREARAEMETPVTRRALDQVAEQRTRRQADEGRWQLAAIVENSDDAIMSLSLDGVVLSWNRGAELLYGYTSLDMCGCYVATIVPTELKEEVPLIMEKLKQNQRVSHFETARLKKNGERISVSITVSPIHDGAGQVIAISSIERDITERKRMEEELVHMSTHDALTNLYNRSLFQTEMERLERGREFPVSVVLADVDGLKRINDSWGHAAGDAVLVKAASVLLASFRAEDVVARIGGDEFGVLLPSTDERVANQLVSRVHNNLALHNRGGDGIILSLSLGTAIVEKGERLADAIKKADDRLYKDKSNHHRPGPGAGVSSVTPDEHFIDTQIHTG